MTVTAGTAAAGNNSIEGVIFDLGNVLIEWNPRRLYRKIFADEEQMAWFLTHVCHHGWNLEQDRGRSWADGIQEAIGRHPEWRREIEAYSLRWEEMMGGAIDGSLSILEELKAQGVPVFALTNWSAETFPLAEARFAFLQWFDARVVSGEERLVKPDPAIFHLMIERAGLPAEKMAFIDDSKTNVESAEAVGLKALHFTDPQRLRRDLLALGLPLAGTPASGEQ